MRIGAAHCGALVLEDLHVAVLSIWDGDTVVIMAIWWECCRGCNLCEEGVGREVRGVDLSPCVDNGQYLYGREVGESQVVRGCKGYDIAFAGDGLCAEKT